MCNYDSTSLSLTATVMGLRILEVSSSEYARNFQRFATQENHCAQDYRGRAGIYAEHVPGTWGREQKIGRSPATGRARVAHPIRPCDRRPYRKVRVRYSSRL